MKDPIFTCPFCKKSTWRTRLTLWWHMRECMQATPKVKIYSANEPLIATA
ncbi:MAG: hypothetical protein ACFCUE_03085 [Candidatus Bathyarchaeia archaeon]